MISTEVHIHSIEIILQKKGNSLILKVDHKDLRGNYNLFSLKRIIMKTIKIFKLSSLFLFILLATQSCMVSSLYPLYTENDLITENKIEGEWIDSDSTKYNFSKFIDKELENSINNIQKNITNLKSTLLNNNSTNIKLNENNDIKIKASIVVNGDTSLYNNIDDFIKDFKIKSNIDSANKPNIRISKLKYSIEQSDKPHFKVTHKGETDVQNLNKEMNKSMDRLDKITGSNIKESIQNLEQELLILQNQAKLPINQYYLIKIIEKNDSTLFTGRLANLGDHYFLDVIPQEDNLEDKLGDNCMISLVAPMHGFFKVEFVDEKLKLNWIYSEDLKKLRKSKKIRLEYISRGDREIITAKTSDIQKFLIKFADSELFNNHKDAELILSPLK